MKTINESQHKWKSPNAKDPWDPFYSMQRYGQHRLTSVELTMTNLCNMRCEHCAVGDALTTSEGDRLPLQLIFDELDKLPYLETISITGGEPSFQKKSIREYMLPILKYAQIRGLKTQINSNLTLDYERYEMIAPYLDVMHISFNYINAAEFHEIGFARAGHTVSRFTAEKMFSRMIENAARLSKEGLFISAETMINYRTWPKLSEIHKQIVTMGCERHEVHPMYPSAFAAALPTISLDTIRDAIHALLDHRNPRIWMLFGTLPFYQCSSDQEHRKLLERLRHETNVTVRNDPDGRNRLNVDLFSGNVYVTDFTDLSSFGNIQQDSLSTLFEQWLKHPLCQSVSCYCPEAACCGPNLLVKNAYYEHVDFTNRKAIF